MTMRLKADGTTGAIAIYSYDTANDAPFTTPLSNVSRLQFHSNLEYPAVVSIVSGTTTLPAVGVATHISTTHTLFAHGRGGTPYVEGYITSGLGQQVGLCGSVIVQQNTGSSSALRFARWVHLGADATNVYLHELGESIDTQGYASLDLGWTVYVLDTLL